MQEIPKEEKQYFNVPYTLEVKTSPRTKKQYYELSLFLQDAETLQPIKPLRIRGSTRLSVMRKAQSYFQEFITRKQREEYRALIPAKPEKDKPPLPTMLFDVSIYDDVAHRPRVYANIHEVMSSSVQQGFFRHTPRPPSYVKAGFKRNEKKIKAWEKDFNQLIPLIQKQQKNIEQYPKLNRMQWILGQYQALMIRSLVNKFNEFIKNYKGAMKNPRVQEANVLKMEQCLYFMIKLIQQISLARNVEDLKAIQKELESEDRQKEQVVGMRHLFFFSYQAWLEKLKDIIKESIEDEDKETPREVSGPSSSYS